jgi:multidrug resistance efflux pump
LVTVAAVGLVEPGSEPIALGSPRSGIVAEVFVQPGNTVKSGQALVRLETLELERELEVAEATVKQAEARATVERERVQVSRHKLASCELELALSRRLLAFATNTSGRRLVSEEDLTQRQSHVAVNEAKVGALNAEIRECEAVASEGTAALEVALARLRLVKNDIARSTISAPMDSVALQVRVRPGEHVNADGGSEPWLVLGRTDEMHVRADVDEHEAWKVRESAAAEAQVRGQPSLKAKLQFVRIEPLVIPKRSLTGESSERVDTRVLQVIYRIDPASRFRLFSGQQVDVFIAATNL